MIERVDLFHYQCSNCGYQGDVEDTDIFSCPDCGVSLCCMRDVQMDRTITLVLGMPTEPGGPDLELYDNVKGSLTMAMELLVGCLVVPALSTGQLSEVDIIDGAIAALVERANSGRVFSKAMLKILVSHMYSLRSDFIAKERGDNN